MRWFVCLSLLVAAAACAQPTPPPVPPFPLATCDDANQWTSGTLETEIVHEGTGALRWDHGTAAAVDLRQAPTDWTAYNGLSFWMHSAEATGSRFMLLIYSENDETEGIDYYSAPLQVNFTGWKQFRYWLPNMGENRQPVGWHKIDRLTLTATGWGNEPNPATSLVLDDFQLSVIEPIKGPRMTEDELFAALDLDRPDLAAVKAAEAAGDRPAAVAALAEYYRTRTIGRAFTPPGQRADPRPANPDTARADRTIDHIMESIGIRHQFGPAIDWRFDKTAEPGYTGAQNPEWTWQLNRHADWIALSRAYRDTWDERYAEEFVAQLTEWIQECPRPEDAGNGARSPWRTIETGIRAAGAWTELWNRFLHSPAMTDEVLMLFLRAYIDHANHIMNYHTTGNWLAMEANGLYHVGALFPEFRDAPVWRQQGADWTYAELDNQVYPDGIQFELASGYHHVSLNNFLGVFKIARHNDLELPADFLARLEKMYDFDVYGALPDRRLPGVQDGGYMDIRGALREAFTLFPERTDFQWYATDGAEGTEPAQTSYGFPWAGYYFMRSGWETDANALMFDGGPFGYGHQHEDKLQIIVHAGGRLLLMDPGVYTYERSKWREYFLDSHSHNVVLVDGQPQRRRGAPSRDMYIIDAPLPHIWETGADHDYVEATYDEAFAAPVGTNVRHTRRVLFVKPDYWVMLDTLEALDGQPHDYQALFHFNDPTTIDGLRLRTQNADDANLTVAALARPSLSVEIVEGREDPVLGWQIVGNSQVRPTPTAVYQWRGTGASHLLTVLAPSAAGQADALASVEPLGDDGLGAVLTFTDGRQHSVRFTGEAPGALAIGAANGTGRALWTDGQRTIVAAPNP